MALEGISGASYQDTINYSPKTVSNNNQGTANLHITESTNTTAQSGSGAKKESGRQSELTVSEKQIKDAVNNANNMMKPHYTRCEFSYHKETNRVSIKVINNETDEVIKEIPPEKALEMLEKMWDLAGILVDEKR